MELSVLNSGKVTTVPVKKIITFKSGVDFIRKNVPHAYNED